ncbi:MAG: 5'/3'-nucleotidase SurE [Elusimicrobia bacterium RIFCSPHIGHO2_02_FULL_57_9]|nr:MAG: 5'/3'-nucleotidase SurE [Elusimicrobia bacterium RIFCSPHIGHO2_02_FULL_57_9]
MTRNTPRILLVNDDGINGPGLSALHSAMRRIGQTIVVVPSQERSADSHSLTLHKPIRVHRAGSDIYALNGSPADCARLGILEIFKSKVDLVVSGINHGHNLGEDVIYSGTVAGAREANLLNVPSIAFSQDFNSDAYRLSAAFAAKLARQVLRHGLPPGIFLNVNFPPPIKGKLGRAVIARLGRRIYSKEVTSRFDPRGGKYYWLAGRSVSGLNTKGTDVSAIAAGHIPITPLHLDSTDLAMMDALHWWKLS